MVKTKLVGQESIVRSGCERSVHAQRNDVGVRVGIAVRLVAVWNLRGRERAVIVRVVGVLMIVSRVLVAVALAHLVRMLHLDSRIGASHVCQRDGDD
jgi:hypothetical protein